MPGFFVCNSIVEIILNDKYPDNLIYESLYNTNGYTVLRNTLNKFMLDKTFCEEGGYICIQDGVLLNKKELFLKYKADSISVLMEKMYESCGDEFFGEFRGTFSGALYDTAKRKWIVYTNQTGEAPLFYINSGRFIAFGSQVNYLITACNTLGVKLSFDENCAYQMLTYAFVPADNTFAREIKRLEGGCYLVVENDKIMKKRYHRFKIDTTRLEGVSEEEIVDMIDNSFRRSVKLEWDKDDEYGLDHVADLSGGLDSRMNMWVAHKLKERHINLLTFCKGGYLDELIAKDIAKYWKDEIIVKQLDDATFMYDIDDTTYYLAGLSLYSGVTGAKRFLEILNWKRFGLEHTGMIGDAVLGCFFEKPENKANREPTGMYSEKLKKRILPYMEDMISDCGDYEIFLLYSRCIRGAANSHLLRRCFTETVSPFMNVDFLELCFSIPANLRMNHYIYKKWILTKYPQAAEFKWEKINGRISENRAVLKTKKLLKRMEKKLTKIFVGDNSPSREGMNPIDYWVTRSKNLSSFLDEYEEKGYYNLPTGVSNRLINDLKRLYKNGTVIEKTMVLTVLSAAKLYFGACK